MRLSRSLVFAVCGTCLGLAACGGDTYCQGGPKNGTSCYSMSDVRQPPGQRPPLTSEPPNWWQPAPPTALGGPSQPTATSGPVPMSSPAWRPQNTIIDAGANLSRD
jgi:hypothetical protein